MGLSAADAVKTRCGQPLTSRSCSQEAPKLLEIDLTDDLGTKGGDVCGGRMWIFVEPYIGD